MIFRKHNCIFFHIVKTAGTSVERWLKPEERDPAIPNRALMFGWDPEFGNLQHATPEILFDLAGPELFEKSFRFTIVRNPFARVASGYFYRYTSLEPHLPTFDQYLRALPELLRKTAVQNQDYVLPQIRYTRLHGVPCCHEIARFEQLPGSLKPVAERLGITRPLPFLNARRHPMQGNRPVSSFYTPETARILVDVYAEDFEAFGYPTDPEAANESRMSREFTG
jgi:hypothetical protein